MSLLDVHVHITSTAASTHCLTTRALLSAGEPGVAGGRAVVVVVVAGAAARGAAPWLAWLRLLHPRRSRIQQHVAVRAEDRARWRCGARPAHEGGRRDRRDQQPPHDEHDARRRHRAHPAGLERVAARQAHHRQDAATSRYVANTPRRVARTHASNLLEDGGFSVSFRLSLYTRLVLSSHLL